MSYKSKNYPLKSFKHSVLIIATALLLLLFLFIRTSASAATITVDDDGNAEYEKIQYAIDNATSGDTISVWEGTYYENVVVNKTINLIGNGSETTTISGNRWNHVVRITVDWVNMSGFSVIGRGMYEKNSGISVQSNNNYIFSNNISNSNHGIYLYETSYCTIGNNTCSSNKNGMAISSSIDCIIINNSCYSNNNHGIFLKGSRNCTLDNNSMNEDGLFLEGNLEQWKFHTMNTTNTINGKPILYYNNAMDFTIPYGAGQVILANCTNVRVENQNCSNGSAGILVGYSHEIMIINNTCSERNVYGIHLYSSLNCEITNNTCTSRNEYGIYLDSSRGCEIKSNILLNNSVDIHLSSSHVCTLYDNICSNSSISGIFIQKSTTCIIKNNSCTNQTSGIHLDTSSDCTIIQNNCSESTGGVFLHNSNHNIITKNNCSNNSLSLSLYTSNYNTITNNTCSNNFIGLCLYISDNNMILDNTISENSGGISLQSSNSNAIYHNYIIYNDNQAFDDGTNRWDGGSDYGGNYWSDYTGDGGSDYPIFGGSNIDRYPMRYGEGEDNEESDMNFRIFFGFLYVAIVCLLVLFTIKMNTWYMMLEKQIARKKKANLPEKFDRSENTNHRPKTPNVDLIEDVEVKVEHEGKVEQQSDGAGDGEEISGEEP